MANPIVPTMEVKKHLVGSYEALARRLAEAALVERVKLFGEDDPGKIRIIGTFKGHAIAVTENAKFVKVFYETASTGELVVVGAETLSVPVYEGAGGVRAFARTEAKSIVESLIEGDVNLTQSRIVDLMRTVDSDPSEADKHIVGSMIEGVLDASRKWHKLLVTDAELAESIGELEPKFFKLADGSIPVAQQEAYRALVVGDLKSLLDSLETIHSAVTESFASLTTLIDTNSELLKEQSIVETQAAVKDLLAHLLSTQATIAEAVQNVHSISALGELHDAVAVELLRFEAAGKYVSRSVAELASNLTK
jgi:hypothetical protein